MSAVCRSSQASAEYLRVLLKLYVRRSVGSVQDVLVAESEEPSKTRFRQESPPSNSH